jgi:hypothetical protein
MYGFLRLATLLILWPILAGCLSDGEARCDAAPAEKPAQSESDLSLTVSSEVIAGDKLTGFAGSSHPPVIVQVLDKSGDDLPTVGLSSADERNTSFSTEVPKSYEHDVILVKAYDGAGGKVTRKVRVVR